MSSAHNEHSAHIERKEERNAPRALSLLCLCIIYGIPEDFKRKNEKIQKEFRIFKQYYPSVKIGILPNGLLERGIETNKMVSEIGDFGQLTFGMETNCFRQTTKTNRKTQVIY